MAGAWRPISILGRAARNAAVLARDVLALPFLRRVPRDWVVLRLDRGLVDVSRGQDLLDLLRSQPPTLADTLQVRERAGGDPRVQGVLLRVGVALGWAQLATLERALARLRAAGKRSVVYAERTGNAGAWLGACADLFWMTPEGHLDLLGVRVESPYVRELLDRLRVRPEVLHAGRYKSAGELIERSGLSDEAREALESVVEDLYGALLRGLAEGRGVSPEVAREWIDRGPYLAADAREAGLVDTLLYADELPGRLAALAAEANPAAPPEDVADAPAEGSEAEAEEAVLLPAAAYQRLSRPRFALEPLRDGRPRIGLILVEGLIRHSAHSARAVVGLLRRAAELSNVRAVVLRINSPGGDPLASDLIWRAVQRLRERKPVVASLADTAASGGYYVAMGANEIIAEPTTLGLKFALWYSELQRDLQRVKDAIANVSYGKISGAGVPSCGYAPAAACASLMPRAGFCSKYEQAIPARPANVKRR